MNQQQFLTVLAKKLKHLPEAERENALSYYEEYFRDAGFVPDTDVTETFGTPSSVAAKIIGEYALADDEPGEKSDSKTNGRKLWIIICAIFAAPIALPLAIAAVVILAALLIALFSVFFALGVTGISLVLTGLAALAGTLFARPIDFPTVVFFIGYAMFCITGGTAACLGIAKLARNAFSAIRKGIGRFLIRRGSL